MLDRSSTHVSCLPHTRFAHDELYIADEVFLTGTAAEVTPVVEVDRRRVAHLHPHAGQRGPVTRALQEKFFACVAGRDPAHTGWLSFITGG